MLRIGATLRLARERPAAPIIGRAHPPRAGRHPLVLPAGNRLRRAPDFALAVRGGRRSGQNSLVVHLRLPIDPAPGAPARVGLVVGKTVGPAVTRNRVKRRLREIVRTRLAVLPPGSVLVVRALPPAAAAGSPALAADLDAGLRRLMAAAEPVGP